MNLTPEEKSKIMDHLNGKPLSIKFTSLHVGNKIVSCSRGEDDEWVILRVREEGREG